LPSSSTFDFHRQIDPVAAFKSFRDSRRQPIFQPAFAPVLRFRVRLVLGLLLPSCFRLAPSTDFRPCFPNQTFDSHRLLNSLSLLSESTSSFRLRSTCPHRVRLQARYPLAPRSLSISSLWLRIIVRGSLRFRRLAVPQLGLCCRPTSNFHRLACLPAVPANLPPTCAGDRSLWRCRPTRLPNLTVYPSPALLSDDPPTCVSDRLWARLSTDFQCPACRPTYFRFSPAICFQLCLPLLSDLRRRLASGYAFN
jgi:hypothetical protein